MPSQLPTLRHVSLTIANAGTAGTAAIGDGMLLGFFWPGTFTGTKVTITASPDGVTYGSIYDATGTIAAEPAKHLNAYQALDPAIFGGLPYVKFTSDGTESQADTFTLLVRN